MKNITLILMLLASLNVVSQTTYIIDDPETLRDVIYEPGDVIILKNGVYNTDERMIFLGSGTAENPVTFRAETPGGVIFTGGPRLTIGGETDDSGAKIATGEYLVVDGFHWKGGYGASNFIEFRNGYDFAHHSTIQNCVIDGLGIEPGELAEDLADEQIPKHRWIVLYGTYNTVINCSFLNKVSSGAIILGEYSYNAFPPVADGEPEINNSCAVVGHTIMNNYFYNYEKMTEKYGRKANGDELSNAGDSETIRLGTSSYQMVNSNATVSNNYFVQSDGENEIITNKSKGNTYTNNTFRRSRGSLVLRHGSYATVEGNYFLGENVDGTGGVRITDSEHIISNNYIKDCITVENFAKWNNGITFIGGSENADVSCTSDDVSNGYQKSQNITISNNSIVNTNAPLFYNEDKGSTDPTGTVSNNLIYFAETYPNEKLTPVISGDSENAFTNLGTALDYTGNVFKGTTLGVTSTGFSEETGIIATTDGEIFTFSGSASIGKGADMGAYEPITDAKVGYGIGACFVNNLGIEITDGDCTIEVIESITVSSLQTLTSVAGSYDVSVNANVSWTAESNDTWITIEPNSGSSGSTIVSITVTKNEVVSSRSGSVTFTQVPGGDDIVKTLYVTQEGVELTELYNLINTGTGLETDKVTITSFSKEEVNGTTKFNYAKNTLDKDNNTLWAADDGDILGGDYKGDGEYIIFDLGDMYDLDLIQFNTTNKSDPFGFQVLVSTTGTNSGDFSMILPETGELLLTATNTTDFNQYEVSSTARYIKLLGYGRFNSTGDERKSAWNAVREIEFYGDLSNQSGDDSDGDGIVDANDNCPNTSNPNQEDFDDDGIGDVCDDDIDGDTILNDLDECPNTPAGEIVDGNGCSDSQLDDDSDGVMNNTDNCLNTPNPNQEDFDGDGIGDVCDDDIDGDTILNDLDECPNTPIGETVDENGCSDGQLDDDSDGVMNDEDNCLNTPNPNQEDFDGDGIGDVCDNDIDGDGVLNDLDNCQETPFGVMVDVNGCTLLSPDNFTIEVVSETCPDKNNGQVYIVATESYDYKLTIGGTTHSFSSETSLDNLSPGTYEICIEVTGIKSPYCYSIEIEEGTVISGKSNLKGKQLNVQVSDGTLPYKVLINGDLQFETYQNDFNINVNHGDIVEVKTAVKCEGTFAKEIQLFDIVSVYPNPSDGLFTVALPMEFANVKVQVFNEVSQLVYSDIYKVDNRRIQLDLIKQPIGVYYIKLYLEKEYVIKIVKK